MAYQEMLLQWGRSNELRKTRRTPIVSTSGFTCFNEAAALMLRKTADKTAIAAALQAQLQ